MTKINHTSEWRTLDQFATKATTKTNKLDEQFGTNGVYQVALKSDIDAIGDDLYSGLIGYTGKSNTIHSRCYGVKYAATSQNGTHGAGRYIRQNGINVDDVVIRCLYTNPGDEAALENNIHTETSKKHGYRFRWKEASGGKDGYLYYVVDYLEYLSLDELRQLKGFINEVAKDKLFKDWDEA